MKCIFKNTLRQHDLSLQVYQVEDMCEEEMPEESDECVRMDRTPPPPTLSPAAITVGRGEDLTSEHPLLGKEIPKYSRS
jgi:hypothetical protein